MSQENVEVMRAVFEAWNAGDMDAFRDFHDPDVVLRAVEGWPEPGPYVGREAVMREWEQLRETWDADAVESDAGENVVALVDQGMRGSEGIDIVLGRYAQVRGFANGRIVGWKIYLSQSEALEAVGLRE